VKSATLASVLATGAVLVSSGSASANPLLITTSTNATTLVNTLLGAGVVLSGTPTLIGASTQQGTFTGGTGILPFDGGVILTTGSALSAPGPNTTESQSTVTGTGANARLTALSGVTTFDQNVLSFDFIPSTNSISFQFVFASEEYGEFVGSPFNDSFGFFLNGTNIALVPGTSTPISINSINCGTNSAFYHPNSGSSPCFNAAQGLNTQYDGLAGGLFSMPLFAFGSVNPNVVNHIDLAIADGSDPIYDSAVFLSAGSFVPTPPGPVPEPVSLFLVATGLAGIRLLRRKH
jgi:hypothetical protein